MAAFSELDWSRFDFWALVVCNGITVVEPDDRPTCHQWLQQYGYAISTIDFANGIGSAIVTMGELFRWEEQFGYALNESSRNLNALRDGFGFGLGGAGGHVFELLNVDVAHSDDPQWLLGLISIAQKYAIRQLALGNRFFTCMVLDHRSPLIGASYEVLSIPQPSDKFARR